MRLSWFVAFSLTLALTLAASAQATKDMRVVAVYWPTRQNVAARVLVMLPASPRAGVMLLPGGHGNLNLDVQGQPGWGLDDFVIRTRMSYPQAGFATLIPDVAIDRKLPAALNGYRQSDSQAEDLAAISDRLQGVASPVFIVAYDRGVTSILNAVGRGKLVKVAGLVLISPVLEMGESTELTLEAGARIAFEKWPVLMIYHMLDGCSAGPAKRLSDLAGAKTPRGFESVPLTGGSGDYKPLDPFAYPGDPCNRQVEHALVGLEDRVNATIIDWLGAH
jgi:hypothetical protein